jgi:hypothetical protein
MVAYSKRTFVEARVNDQLVEVMNAAMLKRDL